MAQVAVMSPDGSVKKIDRDSEEGLQALRKLSALMLKAALQQEFKGIRLGEAIADKDGFHVDSDKDDQQVSADELPALEDVIKGMAKDDVKVEFAEVALDDLKQLSLRRLRCTTAHELMRALEVFDALQLGELVCWSALERKETRGNHVRVDYPFTNPTLNDCFVTITKGPDGPVTAIRQANP